ncbi:HAMP domain-containing sensor histidine kinase [uncultured Fusobacterium sp.]|uniref:sensor histidine kinase n=1 Tax=uncultured Fusobacterium sp. TaxID=159267 RepID=UPI0025DA6130|nr:HAMP domain-containing sensor histidine kinase [uncultured Fusobacterium sp.]
MEKYFKIRLYKKEFILGIIMVIFSIIFPIFLLPYIFSSYDYLIKAIDLWSVEYLIYSASYLVFFNIIKSFPIFFSVFLFMDSIVIKIKEKEKRFLNIILGFTLIQIIYFLIYKFHYDMDYYFGKVAILEMIYISLHSMRKFKIISLFKRNIVLFLIFIGIQWLDITRYFSVLDYRNAGEVFFDLKAIAELLDATFLLDMIGFFTFFLFFSFSISLLLIFLNQEKTKKIYEKEKEMSETFSELAIQETENRYLKEIQYLVHDLKTPLFSIGTLIEILSMGEENKKKLEYYNRIQNSLERCNIMISEILRQEKQNYVKIEEIFNFIFSYLSTHKSIEKIKFYNLAPKTKLKINKIVFARAITNLIVNAYEATLEVETPEIIIRVKHYINYLVITIEDNGIGMEKAQIKNIFEKGYSTKKSSGIGLNFVKTVIEEHNGKIVIRSHKGKGTKFYLIFGRESFKNE